ncbi:MAG: hypothetical protein ACTHN5_14585 [Phycisphaerae bacterium]
MTAVPEESSALYCPTCSYDLRYTTEPRCPECGSPFDRKELAVSRIPWTHRKTLGTFGAWRGTLGLAIRPSQRLGQEIAFPIDGRTAGRFRWLNVLLAALLLAAGNAVLFPFLDPDLFRIHISYTYDVPGLALARIVSPAFALIDNPGRLFIVPIVALVTFAALSWWTPFLVWVTARSSPARPRAAALSHYLSAWFPMAVVAFFLDLGILVVIRDKSGDPSTAGIIAFVVFNVVVLCTWWFAHILLYGHATNAGILRAAIFAILHPVGTFFLFYVVSIATLLLLGLLALMVVSVTT